jgi:hypothetical protein
VREIKRSIGISVPFPDDSQSIIDTIAQALLISPQRKIVARGPRGQGREQLAFEFGGLPEAALAKANVTRMVDEAADREKVSRSIFAQNAIKAHEIEADLRAVDEAIGDPQAVEEFVTKVLTAVLGVQVDRDRRGFRVYAANLPRFLRDLLPGTDPIRISFRSPTPEGYAYIGRNHRFVEQLCQMIMANTLSREGRRAARAAVIRTQQVAVKTTLLLFRCRNVIEQAKGGHQIVAEEMLLWGWRGAPEQREIVLHDEAKNLLAAARAASELSAQARASFLQNELGLLEQLAPEFDAVAEGQAQRLVKAHERFSALMDRQRFQVVYPVLPMDLLGIYVLLPE